MIEVFKGRAELNSDKIELRQRISNFSTFLLIEDPILVDFCVKNKN